MLPSSPFVSGRESGSYPELRAVATGGLLISWISTGPGSPDDLWKMPGQVSLEGGMWLGGQQPGVRGLGQAFQYAQHNLYLPEL